jgi:hypothetical protein
VGNKSSLTLAHILTTLPPEWHDRITALFRSAYQDGYQDGQQDLNDTLEDEDDDDLY